MPYKFSYEVESGIIGAVEHAAIAASNYVGSGDELSADKVAIAAMHEVLSGMAFRGQIVVGEGDEFEAELLYNGENIGYNGGKEYDIALDALEGTALAAKAQHNALSVIAISPKGGLFKAPDIYMDKIAIGPNYPKSIVGFDKTPQENVLAIAEHKGVHPNQVGVCVLDRPRHANLIAALREVGAKVFLISDGDVAGVLFTTDPETDIDIYMGVGGAPEGVLAAAALHCVGGQFMGKFLVRNQDDLLKAKSSDLTEIDKIYETEDLVRDDVVFAACGLTHGLLLNGIRHVGGAIVTKTLSLNSERKITRIVKSMRYPK